MPVQYKELLKDLAATDTEYFQTSIVGLRCVSVVIDSMGFILRGNESEANINLNIYGKFNFELSDSMI